MKPTLFGLVESAEAFTGDGTAVPSLEMRLVEFKGARAVDLCVLIVLDGVESGLLWDRLSGQSVIAANQIGGYGLQHDSGNTLGSRCPDRLLGCRKRPPLLAGSSRWRCPARKLPQ
jgi:hypothetical protein